MSSCRFHMGETRSHHISFDQIEPQWDLFDALVYAVDSLFGVRQDDIGFLVESCQSSLQCLLVNFDERSFLNGQPDPLTTMERPSCKTSSTRSISFLIDRSYQGVLEDLRST
jgi:hypothetical protein